MLLFINACVRKDSRTRLLAERILADAGPVTEIRLTDLDFPKVDEAFLVKRNKLLSEGKFDDPLFDLARQFAEADGIVIAAPFWDFSFPAALKQYLEQVTVLGITFRYTPDGIPKGLCRAKKLTYITTAGGEYVPEEYGFGYVRALAQNFYGIKAVEQVKATGLDIDGTNVEERLKNAL